MLGILNFILGILDFILGILEFLVFNYKILFL